MGGGGGVSSPPLLGWREEFVGPEAQKQKQKKKYCRRRILVGRNDTEAEQSGLM